MAEAALFTVATKILSTLASPAFEKAYERARSIWNARDELNKLKSTVRTIQAVLLDAEKKQDDSKAVKDWIKRVKEVLYDAEDLFDEVATYNMLRQHIKGSKVMKKVQVSCSQLNPFVSNNSIAKKVETIRESLLVISKDMKPFKFVECQHEKPISGMRKGQDPGSFVDSKIVIGRNKDTEAILKMILHESNDSQQDVQVIAIVGIGGMGKTTLAQLVYNHEETIKNFENRWFACISDTSNDTEVLGKIFQSICGTYYGNSTLNDMQTTIKKFIEGNKFLLVLDDVWDDDRVRWRNRMSLFSSGAQGSKIIVSTRSSSVARAVDALEPYNLCDLSEEDSWDLFKSIVSFTPEQEEDSRWTDLGRQILKKCANVPLAINCIASLLFEKNTIQEWESIRNEELPKLGQSHKDGIMPVLKLSYEHLSSNLKHCFAYCSLFPKNHIFDKEVLINLWIAQGYIYSNNEKQTVEDVGHSYFMDLLRRSFFQGGYTIGGYVEGYKMHDLIHDLAIHVAGEEILMLTTSSDEFNGARHVSVGYVADDAWVLPKPFLSVNRLRSFLFLVDLSSCKLFLENHFANFQSLRALSLARLGIENVPSSIGELKHLRYLDISKTKFKKLPDSITKLVNLSTLNISQCRDLEVLPDNFRKLINLRHLYNIGCDSLKHLPPGFEELASLQHLDEFRVGNSVSMCGGQRSTLDVLSQLKLRGKLEIYFEDGTDDWDGVECWQPPLTLQELHMYSYKGMLIPHWGDGSTSNSFLQPKLTSLSLSYCPRVKCIPPFRHIPNIKELFLYSMEELEYIEEEEEPGSDALFIPHLERLVLFNLPKLKGWSRKVEASIGSKGGVASDRNHHSSYTFTRAPPTHLFTFPTLSTLDITKCPQLNSFILCPRLQVMSLNSVTAKVIQQLLHIRDTSSPSTTPSCLESVSIMSCNELARFSGESLTSLRRLDIHNCIKLKKVDLPPSHLNILEYLYLTRCPGLELWEENSMCVEWVSLHKLLELTIDKPPSSEKLPDCLRRRQELGKLKIEI